MSIEITPKPHLAATFLWQGENQQLGRAGEQPTKTPGFLPDATTAKGKHCAAHCQHHPKLWESMPTATNGFIQ